MKQVTQQATISIEKAGHKKLKISSLKINNKEQRIKNKE
jgi:hypothetical protein